jgi:hypothetical protein
VKNPDMYEVVPEMGKGCKRLKWVETHSLSGTLLRLLGMTTKRSSQHTGTQYHDSGGFVV